MPPRAWARALAGLASAAAIAVSISAASAADPTKPHEHQGKIAPYTGAPPPLHLTEAELATLATGQPVLRQTEGNNSGRGVAVLDIHATPARIWSRITNYAMYPKWVDNVAVCERYDGDPRYVFVRFVLDPLGVNVEYYIKHTLRTDAGYITWTLDYSRNSDLDDSVGYWRVTPLSTDPPVSRLEYSVAILAKGWVPGFLVDMISNKGLLNATAWVKKQSELP
jgi:hypothetical protein